VVLWSAYKTDNASMCEGTDITKTRYARQSRNCIIFL